MYMYCLAAVFLFQIKTIIIIMVGWLVGWLVGWWLSLCGCVVRTWWHWHHCRCLDTRWQRWLIVMLRSLTVRSKSSTPTIPKSITSRRTTNSSETGNHWHQQQHWQACSHTRIHGVGSCQHRHQLYMVARFPLTFLLIAFFPIPSVCPPLLLLSPCLPLFLLLYFPSSYLPNF